MQVAGSNPARPAKHIKQIEALDDKSRFQFIVAGRRGGKTALIVEKICEKIAEAPEHSDIFYIGPTMLDAYELIWEKLVQRFDQLKWPYIQHLSRKTFTFRKHRKLYITGAEKIRRVRGHKSWHIFMDEVAFFEKSLKDIWTAIRPSLSDLEGGATIATTPNGKGSQAYEFYLETKASKTWKHISWLTTDNPFISKDEIEQARLDLDEKSFKQEYEASWESFDSLAYYNFDHALHVKHCAGFIDTYPIDILLDFNVNPTSLLVAQFNGHIASTKKEYSLKNSSTIETVGRFAEDFKDKKSSFIRIFGDASGNARKSNTGMADYFYIKEILRTAGFNIEFYVPASNPPIIDRVLHVNSWLKNSRGETKIEIDHNCIDLIKDLSSQEVIGRIPTDKNNLGHKADALGYYIHWLQVNGLRKRQGTVQL